jgi:hypothetical protein
MPSPLLASPIRPAPIQTTMPRGLAATANKVTKRARSSSIVSVTEIPENYDDTLDQGALNNVNADWVNYKGESGWPRQAYGEQEGGGQGWGARVGLDGDGTWQRRGQRYGLCVRAVVYQGAVASGGGDGRVAAGVSRPVQLADSQPSLAGAWLIHVVLILVGIVLLDIIPGMTQDLAWTIVNLGYLTVSPPLLRSPRTQLTQRVPDLVHHVPLRDRRAVRPGEQQRGV